MVTPGRDHEHLVASYNVASPSNEFRHHILASFVRRADEVIGFCGGCRVERDCSCGNWSFMYLKGWTPKLDGEYYHRGIGTVMLAVASEWLKRNGATVQVLFTGLDNPAQRLYRGAGYRYCSISAHNIRKDLSTRPR